MKQMKRNLLSTLLVALLIAVSVFIYLLLPYEKSDFDRLIIRCIVFSELISFFNILVYNAASDKRKLSLSVGGYTASITYVILFVTVSILFSVYYRQAEKTYLILLSVFTAAFLIASVLIYIIGNLLHSNAEKVEKSCAAFKELEYKIDAICSNNEDSTFEATFEKIAEAIKSCDQSNYVDTDREVNDCLEQLMLQINNENKNDETIQAICDRTFALIQQRTAEVGRLKLGGI